MCDPPSFICVSFLPLIMRDPFPLLCMSFLPLLIPKSPLMDLLP